MAELSVVILASDDQSRTLLQTQLNATTIARIPQGGAIAGYPVGATDQLLQRLAELNPDIVLIDIPTATPNVAVRAIELVQSEVAPGSICAIGDMSQPQLIVSAMRAGAREFLGRPVLSANLLEALARMAAVQRKSGSAERGRIITVLNAKGGNGATTIAVNTAVALQASQGQVALVDLASIGMAALHLNARPAFTVVDAFRNMHRLDSSLLESLMVQHGGLHLLAGTAGPLSSDSHADIAPLFDALAAHYRFIVVDASNRLDECSRTAAHLSNFTLLIAQTDVASLWSAGQVRQWLEDQNGQETRCPIRLVLNRFRKIPGFSEADAEAAVGAKLLWKIPNNFPAISAAIDHGTPVVQQNSSDISRSFAGLAAALSESEDRKPAWKAGARQGLFPRFQFKPA